MLQSTDQINASLTDFKKLGKSRELNFVTILVLLGIMAFQYISPNQSQGVLTQYAQRQLDINATISINIIGSLVWFALLYAAIRYFQSVINIEKQYNYTHQLESELSETYNGKAFTREGKAYLNNYSIFSGWVHIVYWYIFPILFLKAEVLAAWLSGKMSCSVTVSRFFIMLRTPILASKPFVYANHLRTLLPRSYLSARRLKQVEVLCGQRLQYVFRHIRL